MYRVKLENENEIIENNNRKLVCINQGTLLLNRGWLNQLWIQGMDK